MKQRSFSSLALLVSLASGACGDDDAAEAAPDERTAEAAPAEPATESEPAEAPESQRPPMRLARFEGTVTVDGEPAEAGAEAGAELESGTKVQTAAGSSAVLDLRDGGRVELGASSIALVGGTAPAQLLLVVGVAHGILPPSGNAPRPPLRIATPAGTAHIGGSGDVWVAAGRNGRAWVATLSGKAELEMHAADEEGRPRVEELAAGQQVNIGAVVGTPGSGPTRAEAAREQAREQVEANNQLDIGELERELDLAAQRVDQALDVLEEEKREGAQIAARHREAVAQGSEEAGDLQRELVRHSRSLLRVQTLALTRWERLRARTALMEVIDHELESDPLTLREGRVERLLGR